MCVCVCAKEWEIDSPFHENFPLVLFPDFHVVVISFYSSEFMCRVLFFYFFMGIKVAFLIPPPHTFVTHDETNQAKCNKSSKV